MPAGTINFGEGCTLEVNDGASSAYVAVVGLTSVEPPDEVSPVIVRRRLSDSAYVGKELGLPDVGEFSFEYEATDVEYARIRALKRVEKGYRITYPDGLRLAFTAKLHTNKPNAIATGDQIQTAKATGVITSLLTVSDTVA